VWRRSERIWSGSSGGRLAQADVRASSKGSRRTRHVNLSGTQEGWPIRASDGEAAATTTGVLVRLTDNRINGSAAVMQRKVVVKSTRADLLKLQKVML
jgi:hypothetical protein